jgi:hypothetical protein
LQSQVPSKFVCMEAQENEIAVEDMCRQKSGRRRRSPVDRRGFSLAESRGIPVNGVQNVVATAADCPRLNETVRT